MNARLLVLVATMVSPPVIASAQQQPVAPQPAPPAVTLGELQRAAVAADPRIAQLALLDRQSALRERNVQTSRLPMFSLDAQTQYQSDVPQSPFRLPTGAPIFTAPHATTDANARVEQRLIDPARQPQLALERAQLAEARARVQTSLFTVKQQIREAFFAVHAIRERLAVLGISVTTLISSRDDAQNRVIAGTAVPADVAQVDAALLDLRQEMQALENQMRGMLQRIEILAGRPMSLGAPLVLPEIEPTFVRSLSGTGLSRPEIVQFTETRTRLARQLDLVDAQQRPRVSAFGRVGYGRPGLNFIGDRFDLYATVGLQVQWRPLTWGSAERDRETLRLQQEIVDADQTAFIKTLNAAMPNYIYPLQRLEQALADDDRIIMLREQVDQTARLRLEAGVITMAEYLARNAELMQARSARAARRVELAQKLAEMQEIAGVEIP